ncbi:MAG: M24 family metallopeptidase [Candidatus Gastranaerophilales bacterium]|nr:M24 family metallopeptidase [Candidatus Gastranaerophilales bacterium]
MDTKLTEYLKDYLSQNDIDGLIINSTNEFLVEYNILELNSRYYVTDFTGSTGDVLFTEDKIYLFVDTRYHEQADNQVNHDFVEVVKMPLYKSYLTALDEKIPSYFKLGIISSKTSKKFYENLTKKLQIKNSSIKLLSSDPVAEFKKEEIKNIKYNVFSVSNEITGMSADEKFQKIKTCAGDKFNILVTSLEDIAYITNLRSYDFDYNATFPAKAIINENGVKIFSECNLPFIGNFFKIYKLSEFDINLKNIEKSELYIDEEKITIADYKLINQSNNILQSYLKLFKTVKNENEIAHLKECFKKSDEALKVVYNMLNSDKIYSEYDYYEALINAMKDKGALSLSFNPIVAAGSNSAIVHYTSPSKEKLVNEGDFLLVDFGGYYEGGLATDTTRTFVKGTPSSEQKTAYTTVLKAFLNAYFNEYNKKSAYFNIDKIARETIEKSITGDYPFLHGTGHGVGISVHENPPIVSSSDAGKTKIIENTVFSIEPGVYKEGWGGIRLENTVYAAVEEDKIVMHSFSHFPFEIKLVDLSQMNDYEKYYYMKWQAGACI